MSKAFAKDDANSVETLLDQPHSLNDSQRSLSPNGILPSSPPSRYWSEPIELEPPNLVTDDFGIAQKYLHAQKAIQPNILISHISKI